jgi:hypothetical protein
MRFSSAFKGLSVTSRFHSKTVPIHKFKTDFLPVIALTRKCGNDWQIPKIFINKFEYCSAYFTRHVASGDVQAGWPIFYKTCCQWRRTGRMGSILQDMLPVATYRQDGLYFTRHVASGNIQAGWPIFSAPFSSWTLNFTKNCWVIRASCSRLSLLSTYRSYIICFMWLYTWRTKRRISGDPVHTCSYVLHLVSLFMREQQWRCSCSQLSSV